MLEKGRYDYAKALSDLAGVDIKNHEDDPIKIIRIARNWLAGFITGKSTDAPAVVWEKFNLFMQSFAEERMKQGFSKDDIYEMPTSEFTGYIKEWLLKYKNPIASGLGSSAIITDGHFIYTSTELKDLSFEVVGGEITRNENGNLISKIKTRSPVVSGQRASEMIGANEEHFVSEESVISTNSAKPTIFTSSLDFTFPRGTTISDYIYDEDVEYKSNTIIKGHLQNLTFKGIFDTIWKTDSPNQNIEASGIFEIHLS